MGDDERQETQSAPEPDANESQQGEQPAAPGGTEEPEGGEEQGEPEE